MRTRLLGARSKWHAKHWCWLCLMQRQQDESLHGFFQFQICSCTAQDLNSHGNWVSRSILRPGAKGVWGGWGGVTPPGPVSVGKFASSLGKIVKFSWGAIRWCKIRWFICITCQQTLIRIGWKYQCKAIWSVSVMVKCEIFSGSPTKVDCLISYYHENELLA